MPAIAPQAEILPVELVLRDGRHVSLRAVCETDREALQTAFKQLSVQSRYTRFLSTLRELPRYMLDRAVSPQPDRELQLVAVCGDGPEETIVGGARYSAAAGSKNCEFALAVTDEWQGVGLARQLLEALMRSARARGLERMEGHILASNARMLGLAKRLGFTRVESPEGPAVHLVQCDLVGKHHGN